MGLYTFKSSLIAPERSWRLEGATLRRDQDPDIALSAVTSVRFIDMPIRYGRRNGWLDLDGPWGRARLACNDAVGGEHRATFLALARDIALVLADIAPDLRIKRGMGRGFRGVFAGMGAGLFLFGLWLIYQTALGEIRADANGYVVGGVIGSVGGLITLAFAPWAATPGISPAELADDIAQRQAAASVSAIG